MFTSKSEKREARSEKREARSEKREARSDALPLVLCLDAQSAATHENGVGSFVVNFLLSSCCDSGAKFTHSPDLRFPCRLLVLDGPSGRSPLLPCLAELQDLTVFCVLHDVVGGDLFDALPTAHLLALAMKDLRPVRHCLVMPVFGPETESFASVASIDGELDVAILLLLRTEQSALF